MRVFGEIEVSFLELKPVFPFVLRIVGAMSLIFVLVLIVTYKLWNNRTIHKSSSSKFFWEIFCPALIVGLIFFIVTALLGSADDGEFMFTDFSEFLAYTGFCGLLITAGVAVFGRHYQEVIETNKQEWEEEARARNRAKKDERASAETIHKEQDAEQAQAYYALAINRLNDGNTDSAIRVYQKVEELDEVLATELYDLIFTEKD